MLAARRRELKEVKKRAEHFEDKCTSIEMFTNIKVHAEMMKEFADGKASSWDVETEQVAWEKIKRCMTNLMARRNQKCLLRRGLRSRAGRRSPSNK